MSGSVAGAEMITFLAPASRCLEASSRLVNRPGGLDHDVGAEVAPGQRGGILLGEDLQLVAVDADAAVRYLHLAREAAQDGVVLEQVGEHLGVDQVVDGDEVDVRARRLGRAEEVAPDAPEAVDADLHCHWRSSWSDLRFRLARAQADAYSGATTISTS